MNRLIAFCLLVATLQPAVTEAQPGNAHGQRTFTNPLAVDFGDPYVLHVKGDKYYMYGTGAGANKGFAAYSSTDLVNWKNEGQVYFHDNKNGWSDPKAAWDGAYWAPEVYAVNGKFYMFYSAQWKENPTNELENFRIGVAVADKPTGPFTDVANKPVFDPGYPIIDANVFFDAAGRIYLYYSRCCYKHPVASEVATWASNQGWYKEIEESWVYGVELKPDFSGVIGEPVLLLRPPVSMNDQQSAWESRSVTSKEVNRRWTEGSVTFREGNTYYIMYSANYFGGKNYAVGYATSSSPLGPFTKAANNPVLEKNVEQGGVVTGTGHNSIAYSPDGKEMFCVYHGRTSATGDKRVVFIDRMKILKNGRLVVEGPTTKPQLMPSGTSANRMKAKAANVFNRRYIKRTLQKVTDWQLKHPKHAPTDWTNGAFYAGVVAAYKTTGSRKILDSLMALGQRTSWQPGRRYDHADDIAISQTYIDLYRLKSAPQMIRATIDTVQKLRTVPGPESKKGLMWWWCDALFMGPPTIVKLGVTLQDPSYFALSDSLFKQTYDLLYNKEQHLFARDAGYLINASGEGKREANGQPVFWSRGNGWVMGGLVRILEELPANYPARSFYEQLYKEMSEKIVTLQQADGLWRASLLDPASYPGGEGSGSGFYCYALAWGVNHGVLDKGKYEPVVRKAWQGLNTLVSPEGRVGWVQPIGADPRRNFNAESYEVYGAGAFLLAGSEVIKLR